ncbi:MAG: XRE family transcriptional regulator [Bacteriovoracaceae bacterium]
MQLTKEGLKFIFGLKLREFRNKKGLSLKEISNLSSLSVSYLNEIEKGKKYPKAEKIVKIAQALNVNFDKLVSLELNDQLRPLLLLLESRILKEFPLEHFGISSFQIFDFFSQAPLKFSAFINTLIEMTHTYDIQIEHFYKAALRSYLEMHNNYFLEIEEKVDKFLKESHSIINQEFLETILIEKFHYKIEKIDFNRIDGLDSIISILKNRTLYLNYLLSSEHLNFILAKEIGYNVLNEEIERKETFLIENATSFEQVLSDYRAAYFAGALLINQQNIVMDLKQFFAHKTWNVLAFKELIEKYHTNEQTFLYRLAQVLPKFFKLNQLFLMKFNRSIETNQNFIAHEIHLSKSHNSHSVAFNEHYCERWITLALIKELESKETNLIGIQRSNFVGSSDEYLCFSVAYRSKQDSNMNTCITIGILVDDMLKKTISFWNDPVILCKEVSKTCERCEIKNCSERRSPPIIANKIEKKMKKTNGIANFLASLSHK